MKMNKNIQWKNSSIDYSELNKVSHAQLVRIENGKLAKESGQLAKAASNGGKVTGNSHYKNKTGLFGMSNKKKKQTVVNGGKAAGKIAVEKGTVIKAGKVSAKSKKHPNNVKVKCEHCGFKTTLPLYRRWHGDNCKHK